MPRSAARPPSRCDSPWGNGRTRTCDRCRSARWPACRACRFRPVRRRPGGRLRRRSGRRRPSGRRPRADRRFAASSAAKAVDMTKRFIRIPSEVDAAAVDDGKVLAARRAGLRNRRVGRRDRIVPARIRTLHVRAPGVADRLHRGVDAGLEPGVGVEVERVQARTRRRAEVDRDAAGERSAAVGVVRQVAAAQLERAGDDVDLQADAVAGEGRVLEVEAGPGEAVEVDAVAVVGEARAVGRDRRRRSGPVSDATPAPLWVKLLWVSWIVAATLPLRTQMAAFGEFDICA